MTGQSGAGKTSQTNQTRRTENTDTVIQVSSTQPSSQFTFIDVPLLDVHDNVGFKTVKARTRKRATWAAHISAAGERAVQSRRLRRSVTTLLPSTRLLFQPRRVIATRTYRRQPPSGLSGPHHRRQHHHHHHNNNSRLGAPVCGSRQLS